MSILHVVYQANERVIKWAKTHGQTPAPKGTEARRRGGGPMRPSVRPARARRAALWTAAILVALFVCRLPGVGAEGAVGGSVYDKRDRVYFGATAPSAYYRGQIDDYAAEGFSADTTARDMYLKYDALAERYKYELFRSDLGVCSDGEQHLFEYDLIPQTYKWVDEKVAVTPPTVLIISGQHGYEKASSMGLYFFVRDLLENADENDSLGWIKANLIIKFIPVCNPYGWDHSLYGNYNGVNLNRNYDTTGFGYATEDKPGDSDYGGEEPFDQPETAMVRDFVLANPDAVLFIDFHTYGHDAVESSWYMNWNELMDVDDEYYQRANYAITSHINRQTVEFQSQYSLYVGNLCVGYQTLGDPNFPSSDAWVTSQGIIGLTVEGFTGFPGGELYTPEVLQANSQIIGNVVLNVISELKK